MKNNKTVLALIWMLFSTGLGKFASLIAQIVLGWILNKNDFGLYALAVSISSSIALLRNGGSQQILIQRGEEYGTLAPVIIKFSFVFNIIACIVLLIAAPVAANIYKAEELSTMITIIGLSIPMSTINTVLRSKLLIDQNFKTVSIIDFTSNIVRQGSTVGFAVMSFGYMSFIWPILLEVLFTMCISHYYVRKIPRGISLKWDQFKELFKDSKWIMLGSLAAALGYSGQYFVIGLFEDTSEIGVYFFGFQLVTSLSVIFTYAIETVFFPLLSAMKNNDNILKKSYLKIISIIFVFVMPISFLVSLMSHDIVILFWKDKWIESIVIIEYLILTIPALMVVSINRSILESRGLWGQRLLALGLFVIGDMLVAGLAAWYGNIYLIAFTTSLFRNLSAIIQCLHVSYQIKVKFCRIMNKVLPSIFFAAISYLSMIFGNRFYFKEELIEFNNSYISGLIFVLIFFSLQLIFENKNFRLITSY